jgi:8-hydroxy-5-deazaflavin:NADPH oxidoreductase
VGEISKICASSLSKRAITLRGEKMSEHAGQNNLPSLAIIGGTGKQGPGLALRWAHAGYKVYIGSREAEKAQATAAEINDTLGIDTVEGFQNQDAALRADVSVLTVVQSAHEAAVSSLIEELKGKIVVDATARVEFRDPRPPSSPGAARMAQNKLGPEARVVGAFQTVPAHILKKKLGERLDTDVLVCSDDVEAAQVVMNLAEDAGMRAYYAGGLDNAVVVEGITSILISLNKHYGVKTASIAVTGVTKDR